jgi:M6 family metalloprotease-like protein
MVCRKFGFSAAVIILLMSLIVPVFAVPAAPHTQLLRLGDGSTIGARMWGDEWLHGWETTDGYAIIFDETRQDWTYAARGVDGSLVSSGQLISTGNPATLIARHTRPAESFRENVVRERETRPSLPDAVPVSGTANVPVILINFSDRTPDFSPDDFNSLLFGSGTKSMKDYYQEVSHGTFSVSAGPGGIAGWTTASRGHDYYGRSTNSSAFGWSGTLVREAVAAADPAFDFAPYDSDGDCYVDVVNIVHEGNGEEAGGDTTDIWSHSYDLNSAEWYGISDGGEYTTDDVCPAGGFVRVNAYVIQPETLWGNQQTIGVFAHEYAHALGVPDLYDGTYVSAGVGSWSLMGSGCWNQLSAGGDTPAHMDAWSKSKLGWVVPQQVTEPDLTTIRNAEQFSEAFRILDNPGGVDDWRWYGSGTGEYFLVENRQKTGFDAALPGEGLLIWHIDESIGNNQNPSHKLVDLEEADGENDLDLNTNAGDVSDPWYDSPGGFGTGSNPDSKLYNGSRSGVRVTGISTSAPVMEAYLGAVESSGGSTIDPGDSIQLAINSAESGDTIILNPGTYYEHDITINKDITIRANTSIGGSASDTVIDAGMAGRIFNLTGGFSLDIDNLTLLNGYTNGINNNGGAMNAVFSGSTITITSSSVFNSSAYNGGAIYAGSGSTVSIISSSITNCRAVGNGGAISATFSNLTISDSVIYDSFASYDGGAIDSYGGNISLTSTIISNCSATSGGAISSRYGGTVISTNTTFSGCSGSIGSAIYSRDGNLTIDSSTFSNCIGDQVGAIYFFSASTANITRSVFENCSAGFGGAIETYQIGTLIIDSSTFSNCSSGDQGGAIESSSEITIITSTSFTNCSSGDGGAIGFGSGTAFIESSTFSNCSAGMGGAIYDFGGALNITTTSFSDCVAYDYGGGAIFAHGSTVTISSSVFSDCSANNYGGSINCEWDSIVTIDSTAFSNCSAGNQGSAIYSKASTVHNHFSRFSNNTGTVVINNAGTFDATNNWWGTSSDPSGYVSGTVTTSPRLVLNISATPSSVATGTPSLIRVNLTRNSAGTDTANGGIFVPDGIPIAFSRTSGTGTLVPQAGTITTGANTTTFIPAGAGTSTVAATVDGETVSTGITATGSAGPADKVGVFRPSTHLFYEDYNGNGWWNGAGIDRLRDFGITGDIPVTGDWNNDGITDIGVFRPSTHLFYLDYNGNGWWNGAGIDRLRNFGITGDIPISGDWNSDGTTDIGIFRPSTHLFYLDYNGNGVWNGAVTDRSYNFGITGDIPISGDWNTDGITDIGVFRPSTHLFYLDYNGNGVWNGAVSDRSYNFGITGDTPVTGDWNHDGATDIGIFRPSTHLFYLDYNGNGVWNGAVTDRLYNFGITGDIPVTGKWS